MWLQAHVKPLVGEGTPHESTQAAHPSTHTPLPSPLLDRTMSSRVGTMLRSRCIHTGSAAVSALADVKSSRPPASAEKGERATEGTAAAASSAARPLAGAAAVGGLVAHAKATRDSGSASVAGGGRTAAQART